MIKKLQYFEKTKLYFVKVVEKYVEMWKNLQNYDIKLACIFSLIGTMVIDMLKQTENEWRLTFPGRFYVLYKADKKTESTAFLFHPN